MKGRDEFDLGRFENLVSALGAIAAPSTFDKQLLLDLCRFSAEWLEDYELPASARHLNTLVGVLERDEGREKAKSQATIVRTTLHAELDTMVFLHVESARARHYREPRRSWEEVISRFPDTVIDIEEANKCYALGRYAAAIFHSVQIVEIGLIALGVFLKVRDHKSGFTAATNELKRILNKKHDERSEFERNHLQFFEQIFVTTEALKNAWRNKISHAQGKLILLSSEFAPEIAEEILMASRAYMRRLAEDLPR